MADRTNGVVEAMGAAALAGAAPARAALVSDAVLTSTLLISELSLKLLGLGDEGRVGGTAEVSETNLNIMLVVATG